MPTTRHGRIRPVVFRAMLATGLMFFSQPLAAQLEPVAVGTPTAIEVYPKSVRLDASRRRMHLIVTGEYAEGQLQDLTRVAKFTSSDEKIVRIDGAVAVPVADGQTKITVSAGGYQHSIDVTVANHAAPDPVSFHYETMVALTKQGCNAGACHGSPSGKGGFRLSLAAYDPKLDIHTLIREEFGRRTNSVKPEASLLLAKPLMQIAHGGGRRLSRSDASYQVLRNWIAEGRNVDSTETLKCVKIEVYPPSGRVLKRPAHTQQLLIRAHFSDGSVRDVTDLAKFSSSDDAVATVTPGGLVVGHDRGEIAVLVRHLEKVETCYLTFVKDIEGFAWKPTEQNNYVDELVDKKLEQLKFLPGELCSDGEFIRRVTLDVIGSLPKIKEVETFLADTSSDKRTKLIDHLLQRPEYAHFWALKWGDLLRLNNKSVTAAGVHKYYQWLVRSFETNMPYDRFASELLLATGSTYTNPPANFYRTAADTNDSTETTAQVFLGLRLQCAKCHNHPFERWTQDNYYGMGAFFNRVQRKKTNRKDELVIWVARGGEVTQPRTGKQMKPWLPLTGDAPDVGEDDRRQVFRDWLVKAENPFFARVEVNRIWAHVIGRGIVEPVDDFRDSNPPSNGELLDALAADFANSGYDRKHILKRILSSRTYQTGARTNAFNQDDSKYFSHAQIRLLGAEQLLDAICHVTDRPETFAGLPEGTLATHLPSPDVKNDFLKVFGQPERQTACACERSSESNLSQALQLFNGPLIHKKLQDKDNRFRKLVAAGKSDTQIVTQLYLAALARKPNANELAAATGHITGKPDRAKALEDVCWALLNTNEFLFQH